MCVQVNVIYIYIYIRICICMYTNLATSWGLRVFWLESPNVRYKFCCLFFMWIEQTTTAITEKKNRKKWKKRKCSLIINGSCIIMIRRRQLYDDDYGLCSPYIHIYITQCDLRKPQESVFCIPIDDKFSLFPAVYAKINKCFTCIVHLRPKVEIQLWNI